jgi:ECF sigma factor
VDRPSLLDKSGRAHFFGIAAQMMRRILVDYARQRRYGGSGWTE